MGIFDFFKRKDTKSNTLTLEQAIRLGIPVSSSGVQVSVDTALQYSTVCACVDTIAKGVAQIPFRLYRQEDRVRKPATNKPLYRLFQRGPNPYQSEYEFRYMIAMHMALTGNAFVWLNRVAGRIVEMFPYPPQSVNFFKTPKGDGWEQTYEITLYNGTVVRVPDADVWHLRWRAFNGIKGLNAIELARQAIGIGIAGERMTSSVYERGVKVDGFLSTEKNLSKEARELLREEWENNYGGVNNAGKTPIMGGDLQFKSIVQSSAQDAQLIESRSFQINEVCRMFGVQPIMVYHYTNTSTFASSEQMFLAHVVHTLSPWYRMIETSANCNLLTEQETERGYYFKFLEAGLLRGDMKSQSEWIKTMIEHGVMSPNEARELLEMNPYDGGDTYLVPLNMTTPDMIGIQIDTAKVELENLKKEPVVNPAPSTASTDDGNTDSAGNTTGD